MRPTIELPNKPSDLLEVAINDFEKIVADPRYSIRMTVWHVPAHNSSDWQQSNDTDKCQVCLAGAVMACRGTDIATAIIPDDFDQITHKKLEVIDKMRCGDFGLALDMLGFVAPAGMDLDFDELERWSVPDYADRIDWADPETVAEYVTGYREIIKLLREKGC